MKLSEEDGKLFMKLWSDLTDYVSEQKNLENPLLWPPERVNTKEFHTAYTVLLDALFSEDGVLIDSFVSANPDLPGDHQDLVLSWKNLHFAVGMCLITTFPMYSSLSFVMLIY